MKLLSHVQLLETPCTVASQASLSMGFSRQEYWNGLSFPSPVDLPDPGIEPGSPALQADSLPSEPPGNPQFLFFFHENVLNVVKCFFYISLDNHFFLHSFNVVYFNQFSYSLHSMNKSHLVMVYKPFSMILNLVC